MLLIKIKLFFVINMVLIGHLYALERIQEVNLKKGWNSIYLEVTPIINAQDLSGFILKTVEENSTIPIEIISTYLPKATSVQYIDSPNEKVWKKAGWHSWIRDDLPESFLTNLYDLQAGKAYLIQSSKDFTWKVKGKVEKITIPWHSNSFNFVGFQVTGASSSFHQLFQKSNAYESFVNGPIYALRDEVWEKVSFPDVAVKSGEAYWVFTEGQSSFQGNVELSLEGGGSVLNYLDIVQTRTVLLHNNSTVEQSVTLSLEENKVPLSLVSQDSLGKSIKTPVSNVIMSLTLASEEKKLIKLSIRRNEINDKEEKQGLLKMLVESTQEVQYLPISAYGGQQ